jgi:peptidoglycan/xylan/chitin deacetylase (PgdA/CDA1 family)
MSRSKAAVALVATLAIGGTVTGVGLRRAHATSVRLTVAGKPVRLTAKEPTVASALRAVHAVPRDGVLRSIVTHRVIDGHAAPARVYVDGLLATRNTILGDGSVVTFVDGTDAVEAMDRRKTPVPGAGLPPVEFTLWHVGVPGLDEIDVGRTSGEIGQRVHISVGGPAARVTEKVVALTFDDGPDPRWTPAILDILRAEGVKATFCMVGHWADKRPSFARQVVAEGHTLCDHTVHHLMHLDRRPHSQIVDEVNGGADIVKRVCGHTPAFYRAPGGTLSQDVIDVAHQRGLRVLGWSIDPHDYQRPPADVIKARILSRVGPGAVILMHDGGGDRSNTVEMLRSLIDELKALGYGFVTPEVTR